MYIIVVSISGIGYDLGKNIDSLNIKRAFSDILKDSNEGWTFYCCEWCNLPSEIESKVQQHKRKRKFTQF